MESRLEGNHGGYPSSELESVRVMRHVLGRKAGNDCVPVVRVQPNGHGEHSGV